MTSSASHDRAPSFVPSRPVTWFVSLLAAALVLPLLSGCPGVLAPGTYKDPGGPGGGTGGMTGTVCTDALTQVIQKDSTMGGCLGGGCHTSPSPFKPHLDPGAFDKAMLKATNASTAFSGPCGDQPFINAANPSESVILKKVRGTDCGTRMPYMPMPPLTYLSQADQDCIAAWVAAP